MVKKRSEVESDISLVKAKMIKASDIQTEFKACFYGRNKVGKTRLACSSGLDTFLIDCNEKGTDSVRGNSNVTVYPMTKYDDLDPAYWYLKSSNHPHKVVVIDTISMLATIGMKWVLKDDLDRDLDRDPLTPDKRSWGKLGEAMKETILRFRNLPMHVIFLAQEKTTTSDDDDGGTVIEVHPELSPAPRSTLLSAVGTIGRLYIKEVERNEKTVMERRLLLGAHPKYVSGTRFSEELKYVEINPTLDKILAKINGGTDAGN
jgi:hypothetical protein